MPFFQNSELLCDELGWEFKTHTPNGVPLGLNGVCGSSDYGMGGCLNAATWRQANARCRQFGARLCTLSELPVTRHTGCGHDEEYVWVHEPCDHENEVPHWVAAHPINDRKEEYQWKALHHCVPGTDLNAVRCCADGSIRQGGGGSGFPAVAAAVAAAAEPAAEPAAAVAATTFAAAGAAAVVAAAAVAAAEPTAPLAAAALTAAVAATAVAAAAVAAAVAASVTTAVAAAPPVRRALILPVLAAR